MRRFTFLRPSAIGFTALLLLGMAAAPNGAAAQTQGAEGFISNLGQRAMQALGPSVPRSLRTAEFTQLFRSDFDMAEIARFVMGPYRNRLTPEQQQEFTRLLREEAAHAYARKLEQYAGDQFRVTGERPSGGGVLVYSQVLQPGGKPIALNWEVVNRDGRFQITDVYVDGVSMKLQERQEFAGIVQRNGGNPQAMIAALRQELAVGY